MKILGYELNKISNVAPKPRKSAAQYISDRQKFRMHEDLAKLRIAIDDFENLNLFNREQIHRIFREVWKDPHLQSQWNSRKLKTIEKEFKLVDAAGEESELTKVLQDQWFLDLLHHILDSKLWGFSLIEFGEVKDGTILSVKAENMKPARIYDPIYLVDRDYVKPEFGFIGKEPSSSIGLPFEGGEFDDQLLFVGRRHDLGLLISAVKYVLFKDNCIANWSEWAEIFGMDMRVGKTAAQDGDRAKFLDTLKRIGASGYGIIDTDDVIEYHGTARTDAYQVYKALCEYADTNVSKLIWGQDVVTNNTGRVIGSVGETISNLYGDSDAKYVATIIDKQVLPKLTKLGLAKFDGLIFKWDTTEKLTLKDNAAIDLQISQMGWKPSKDYLEEKYGTMLEDAPPEPDPNAMPVKKPLVTNVHSALKELYASGV